MYTLRTAKVTMIYYTYIVYSIAGRRVKNWNLSVLLLKIIISQACVIYEVMIIQLGANTTRVNGKFFL